MLEEFKNFIRQNQLLKNNSNVLLAVSAGVDSVVMCHLFYTANIKFSIAHCNFNLRGQESDADEKFVKSIAKKYNVPFYTKTFNTKKYTNRKGISIQMAARELRYSWFEEIRKKGSYNYIATAHHKDDSIETLFINLIRGTGIVGLHGILPKQKYLIRPLLFAGKAEIKKFAKTNNIQYREDSSNASDKYLRNKIRLNIIPTLKKISPSIEQNILQTIENIKEAEKIYFFAIEQERNRIIKKSKEQISISIEELKKLPSISTYLYEFIKEYGFSSVVVNDIIKTLDKESGKKFISTFYQITKDRKHLFITKKEKENLTPSITFRLKSNKDSKISSSSKKAFLDYDTLTLPLKIRKWQNGDYFYPLGMKQRKKLSDFFIDKKVPLHTKNNSYVLTSNNNIVWVINYRIDDRFKVTEKTKNIYVCELTEDIVTLNND